MTFRLKSKAPFVMYFKDLTRYVYRGGELYRPFTKNVGWLAKGHDFEKLTPDEALLDLLWTYCGISIAQTRGIHDCDLCCEPRSILEERKGEKLLLGTSEIRVFDPGGLIIYAAPTLVYHYVAAHHYKPPDEFLFALQSGAKPPEEAFFRRLTELSLDYRKTSAPDTLNTYRFKKQGFDVQRVS